MTLPDYVLRSMEKLTKLDISTIAPNLTHLYLYHIGKLTTLDLSKLTNLKDIYLDKIDTEDY